MEIEREEVDREYNWALVSAIVLEIRGHVLTCFMPTDQVLFTGSTVSGGADRRTSSLVFLFEEFVLEYRQQLSTGAQNKRTQTSFSPGMSEHWE